MFGSLVSDRDSARRLALVTVGMLYESGFLVGKIPDEGEFASMIIVT